MTKNKPKMLGIWRNKFEHHVPLVNPENQVRKTVENAGNMPVKAFHAY